MPKDSKKKRKSSESLEKAREALKKSKLAQEVSVQQTGESSITIPESTAHSSSLSVVSSTHTEPFLNTQAESSGIASAQPSNSPSKEDDSRAPEEDQPMNSDAMTPKPPSEGSAHSKTRAEIMEEFCEEWLGTIDRDDKKSLAIFLCHIFVKYFSKNNTEVSYESVNACVSLVTLVYIHCRPLS